ncbi:hypothetical protein PN623_24330 [Parabacteroides distasonis]|uniref:hypothetical protein n=1 Tax=Parabacteroides distasonis TaxID=823 RepID=UPI00232D629D|nr:hypothetical protein [Parabacteroides distasonis]MDB9167366.1 hypothetical protein [Parabacteroides distasonis]MDB9197399.1 hypothetical protein [Parabacteroides distasonis]
MPLYALPASTRFPYNSNPASPVIFSAKFDCRLSVLSRTIRLLRKIFLSDTSESVFAASSLPGPVANPAGRKIISLPVQDVSEGK